MTCFDRDRAPRLRRVAPGFRGTDDLGPDILDGDVVELVRIATTRECLTDRIDCDPETAACRALGQYLALCERDHRGRRLAFETVVESWPDLQDVEQGLPALGVWRGDAPGVYDARRMTPRVERPSIERPGIGLQTSADWTASLAVEVWATDKIERSGLRMLIEEALSPVDWIYGARLAVPWYGGVHLEFSLEAGGFADDPALIEAGIRRSVFTVRAVVPVWRPVLLPEAVVQAVGTARIAGDGSPVARRPLSIR